MKPEVKVNRIGTASEELVYTHPAQGVIEITRMSVGGRGIALFGSALKHHAAIRIHVRRATRHRHLNRDWNMPGATLCEFTVSESQWASIVSSIGQGGGTPITLGYVRDGDLETMPRLENDPIKDTFDQEIKESTAKAIEELRDIAARLKEMPDAPSISKVKLRSLANDLENRLANLPENMAFVQKSFAEAMEQTVEAGKAEVEGFVRNTLVSAGMEKFADQARVALLTNESKAT